MNTARNLTDAELQQEVARRNEIKRLAGRASDLLRSFAVDEKWNPGKKMTTYQADAAVRVVCAALQVDAAIFAEAMMQYAANKKKLDAS